MNFRISVFIALAAVLTSARSWAGEAVWPNSSASELSIFLTLLKFQNYADHCSANVPQLKPEFDGLMKSLNSHMQVISKDLLASGEFKGMRDKPVPAEIIHAFKDSFDDAKHNFERRDAASICPKTLQNLGEMTDEALKSDLREILTAVQNMIRNLEKESAHQANPNGTGHQAAFLH